MQEELISFETAILAKEKGFDVIVNHFYHKINKKKKKLGSSMFPTNWNRVSGSNRAYSSPTQALLQKWLREIHQIDVKVWAEHYLDGTNWCVQSVHWNLIPEEVHSCADLNFIDAGSFSFGDDGEYPTYELALEKGLLEGLKLIK